MGRAFSTMKSKYIYHSRLGLGLVLLCWLFIGILEVEAENEIKHELFIKKIPTLRINFSNPYESVPTSEEDSYSKRRDEHGDWLPKTKELGDYLQYCKYKYGVTDDVQALARAKCKNYELSQ